MHTPIHRALVRAGLAAGIAIAAIPMLPASAQSLTSISFPQPPIAAAGSIGPSQSVPLVATAKDGSSPAAGVVIYIDQYAGVSGDATLLPASQCGGRTQLPGINQYVACTTDSNGQVVMSYRAPAQPPATGEADWYAQQNNSGSNPGIRAITHYVYSTNFRFSPSPIAPGGSLGAGASVPVAVTAESALDQGIASDTVYLAFRQASGGGAAYVGTTRLTSTPALFTADSSGTVQVTYVAPSSLPASGLDQIVAQATYSAGNQASQNVDDYSFSAAPVVSIGDAGSAEAVVKPGIPAMFTVTVTPVQPNPVTVPYTTSCGIGDKWCSEDFRVDTSSPLSVTIPANTSSTKIHIGLYSYPGRNEGEGYNEGWFVHLGNPSESGASVVLGRSIGEGTEYPDTEATSAPPDLYIGSAGMVPTTDTGGAKIFFTVTLGVTSSQPVTFNYATSDGSAVAGVNYTAKAGTATIAAGKTSVVIPIVILASSPPSSNLTFSITISNASGGLTILRPTGTGTILAG